MLEFDSLALAFNRQSPLTIYCAVRSPNNDFEATAYPEWLIEHYGQPFEESIFKCDDGGIQQVLLFSDCGSDRESLQVWRANAKTAGLEVIRLGLTADRKFKHSPTVEWVLACKGITPGLKTDFLDQDNFNEDLGIITWIENAWVVSDAVRRQLCKTEASDKNPKKETVKKVDDCLTLAKNWTMKSRRFGGPTKDQKTLIELILAAGGWISHADLCGGAFDWEDPRKSAVGMAGRINKTIKKTEQWEIIPEDNSGCRIVPRIGSKKSSK